MSIETTDPGQGAGGSPTPDAAATQTPTPLKITNDSLIQLEGSDKPVKFADHFKGIQSQFTKKSQEAAQLSQRVAQMEAVLKERERQLQTASQRGNGQQPNPRASLAEKLKSLAYLDGATAADVISQVLGEVDGLSKSQRERDNAIMIIAQHLAQQKQEFGSVRERDATTQFTGKISNWVKELELPDELGEWAQELYLAYEPTEELDAEFPSILKNRFDQLAKVVRALDKQRLDQARSKPWVPGKGGQGSPSNQLKRGFQSAKEIADSMWDGMVKGGSDT